MAKPLQSQTDDSGFIVHVVPLGKTNIAPTDQLFKAEAEHGTPHSKFQVPPVIVVNSILYIQTPFLVDAPTNSDFVSLAKGVYL
jgi:hypothetical protein